MTITRCHEDRKDFPLNILSLHGLLHLLLFLIYKIWFGIIWTTTTTELHVVRLSLRLRLPIVIYHGRTDGKRLVRWLTIVVTPIKIGQQTIIKRKARTWSSPCECLCVSWLTDWGPFKWRHWNVIIFNAIVQFYTSMVHYFCKNQTALVWYEISSK